MNSAEAGEELEENAMDIDGDDLAKMFANLAVHGMTV